MGDKEVKVFGNWGSPFSCRVEIALKLKGVDYEFINEDMQNKSPLLLKYNPVHKKIPVLLHHGNPIAESLVIIEYIDETWKQNPILPQDPYERAKARFWARFFDEKCLAAVWSACSGTENEKQKAKEEAKEHLKTLESELNGKKFFGGDTIGLVDITAKVLSYWIIIIQEIVGVDLLNREEFPKLFDWIDNLLDCSIIKENLPPRDELVAVFRARFGAK